MTMLRLVLPIVPVLLPVVVAAAMLLSLRHRLRGARIAGVASAVTLLCVAVLMVADVDTGRVTMHAAGDWPAPFGIVLVVDRLAALMLLLTAVLGVTVLWHAIQTGLDQRGAHFHPLFQFQLAGLNGAFLTGDLFNLFVFFEVLLIASYALLLHGQGAVRLRAGFHYVVVNLVGSTLFLIALGLLYGVTGTLNMADMGVRIAALPADDAWLARAGAALLLTVFALKAAMVPLHQWLPHSYAGAAAPVAALFAILTKVGVYAIVRTGTSVFGHGATGHPWLWAAALATVIVGFAGLVAAPGLRAAAAWTIVGSTGTLLLAAASGGAERLAAAIFYLPVSTLAGAALFLLADLLARRRPLRDDRLIAGNFADRAVLGTLFGITAIAVLGLPPLAGFLGKLLILESLLTASGAAWSWAVILGSTLIGVIALARAGSILFLAGVSGPAEAARGILPAAVAVRPLVVLIAGIVALTVAAGPVSRFADATARQLLAERVPA